MDIDKAYNYCRDAALGHYENFPVASLLIPGKLRKHIYAVYAFARYADDIADNALLTDEEKISGLKRCSEKLKNPGEDMIFAALECTIKKFNLPIEEFEKLLRAFCQDVTKKRYKTIEELIEYASCSANPIGRIFLNISGADDIKAAVEYSDKICTALQLINFWQDVSEDIKIDRVYIPENIIYQYNYSYKKLFSEIENLEFKKIIKYLTDWTQNLMNEGKPLINILRGRFRYELKLIISGGEMILKKIALNDYNTLKKRPSLTIPDKLILLFKCMMI